MRFEILGEIRDEQAIASGVGVRIRAHLRQAHGPGRTLEYQPFARQNSDIPWPTGANTLPVTLIPYTQNNKNRRGEIKLTARGRLVCCWKSAWD